MIILLSFVAILFENIFRIAPARKGWQIGMIVMISRDAFFVYFGAEIKSFLLFQTRLNFYAK